MTARTLVYWVTITVVFMVLSVVLNGLFFGTWSITPQQTLVGVLIGLFAGAVLDLFMGSLSEPEG